MNDDWGPATSKIAPLAVTVYSSLESGIQSLWISAGLSLSPVSTALFHEDLEQQPVMPTFTKGSKFNIMLSLR